MWCPLLRPPEPRRNRTAFPWVGELWGNYEGIWWVDSTTSYASIDKYTKLCEDLINFKIPAIIYPLPSAKDNHQYENARILSEIDCAIIIDKNKIDFDKIILFIRKVVNDKNFNKSLLNKYSKIKKQNTNELMWTIIQNDQKK